MDTRCFSGTRRHSRDYYDHDDGDAYSRNTQRLVAHPLTMYQPSQDSTLFVPSSGHPVAKRGPYRPDGSQKVCRLRCQNNAYCGCY